jgi:hypothetical protein
MKQAFAAWLLCLLSAVAAAQVTGAIPSTGGGAGCVQISVGPKGSSVGITVSGTWSGTLQPEVSIQGQAAANTQVTPSTSSTAASTITANGTYFTVGVAGADTFLLCGNTVASGTANVFLNISTAGSAAKGGSSGGAGTVTHTAGALTSGGVVIGNGTADIKVDSGCSTNGTGTMTCVTNATSGSNGGFSGTEGTGGSLTAGSGTDLLWPDSTAHRWIFNPNNAGALDMVGIATAGVSGNCAKLATNGIDVVDSGIACTSGTAVVTFRGNCAGLVAAGPATSGGLNGLGGSTANGGCAQTTLNSYWGSLNTRSCTLKNFYIHSQTNGSGVTDGVATVQVNAGATSITCTLGTSSACHDTTHTAASVAGDMIWVSMTVAGAADLRDLSASVECQ